MAMAYFFPEVKMYPLSISKGNDACLACSNAITSPKSPSGSLPMLLANIPVAGIMIICTSLASCESMESGLDKICSMRS